MKIRILSMLTVMFLAMHATVMTAAVPQASGIKTVPLKFKPGTSSATVNGTIKGRNTIDYKLGARGGQTMTVKLKSRSTSLYFNILPAENQETGEALNVEPRPVEVTDWSGELPGDGEYVIRVYLNRAAARRGASAAYSLTVSIR